MNLFRIIRLLVISLSYTFFVGSSFAQDFTEIKQLVQDGPIVDFGDNFGNHKQSAIEDDIIAVSGISKTIHSNNSGVVCIYQKDHGGLNNWGLIKTMYSVNQFSQDHFGSSVAISEGLLIVGDNNAEVAYIYSRDLGGQDNWGLIKTLTASDGATGDNFGHAVDIDRNIIIVGAMRDDDGGSASGSAYIFAKDFGGINQWGEVKKLTASDATSNDNFGQNVSISGSAAVVGAYQNDDLGPNTGSAYVFQEGFGGESNWGEVKKLLPEDGTSLDNFGFDVAISANLVMIGSPQNDNQGYLQNGAVYIFDRNHGGQNNWGMTQKLLTDDPNHNDFFGISLDIDGDLAIIGSAFQNSWTGAAYIFQKNNNGTNTWSQIDKLEPSDGEEKDYFGYSCAISGANAVIGAPSKFAGDYSYAPGEEKLVKEGIAYLFSAGDCPSNLTISDNPINNKFYQASMSISSSGLVPDNGLVKFGSNTISLTNGFEVNLEGQFEALIDPCQ